MLSCIFNKTLQLRPICVKAVASPSAIFWSNPLLLLTRSKHSSTQIKRIFNKHPARARFEQREGIIHKDEQLPNYAPQFAPIFEPELLSNGWSAPPPADVAARTAEYPFKVMRTKNKPMDAAGFLPVYAKFRKDGTKAVTRIKKVAGDQTAFLQELMATLQLPTSQVRVRTGGTIEVNGNRVRDVKRWLAGLGF
ncbi:hypothetical protein MPSEU_000986100 [Mayamaea pseudoterrestris]|nr:hypothetical protein MPSEU_000986100 [Mayamaea pseudoterrestris]